MEQNEQKHIIENLHRLIELTDCNTLLMSKLLEKKVLSYENREEITSHRTPQKQAEALYKCIVKKADSYNILLDALKNTKQSGAFKILENISLTERTDKDVASKVDQMFQEVSKSQNREETLVRRERERIEFDLMNPAYLFTGRDEELAKLHKTLNRNESQNQALPNITSIVCISGLGGIGKTELSRKYCQRYREFYDDIIWINAEREDTIRECFLRLANDLLGITTRNADGSEKNIKTILTDIYKTLTTKGKTLIVFDNAENDESFRKFLCIPHATPSSKVPVVLITSRDTSWPADMDIFLLEEMKFEDASEFVKRAIPSEAQNIREIDELVKTLQYFPLAIHQAVSYICEKAKRNPTYNIMLYLTELPDKKKILLNSTSFQGLFNDYKKTTLSTWTLTINAIAADQKYGEVAKKILHAISYFSAEKIPLSIFIQWANGNHDLVRGAVNLLVKFSMVKEDPSHEGLLSIHRLVQDVIQIQLLDEKKNEKVLSECCELFQLIIHEGCVEHGISVWNHASKYKNLVEKYSSFPNLLIQCMIDARNYNTGAEFATEALNILGHVLGEHHINVTSTERQIAEISIATGKYDVGIQKYKCLIQKLRLSDSCNESECLLMEHQIGRVLARQAKYEDALAYLSIALEKRERLFGKDNIEYFDCLKSHIFPLMNIGNYKLALQHSDTVLQNYKRLLGEDSEKALATVQDYAVVHAEMGNISVAISILKDTYKKMLERFGPENYHTIMCGHNLAVFLRRDGKNEESYELFKVIYEITKKLEGPSHPETIVTLEAMAEVLLNMNQHEKALSIFLEVYQAHLDHFGEESYKTLDSRFKVATALSKRGNAEEALYILNKLLEILEGKLGSQHIRVWKVRVEIAKILNEKEKYIDAINILQSVNTIDYTSFVNNVVPPIYVEATTLLSAVKNHI